jgi:hypothetical protein
MSKDFVKLLQTYAPYLNETQAENLLKDLTVVLGLALAEVQIYGAGKRTVAYLLQRQKLAHTQRALQEAIVSAMEESRPSVHVNHKKTITPSLRNADGVMDEFYDTRNPPEGFLYPEQGTEIIALCNYGQEYGSGTYVPAGTRGIVTGIRAPGTHKKHHGYVGCVAYFGEIQKSHPAGTVIPWDCMEAFEFLHHEGFENT